MTSSFVQRQQTPKKREFTVLTNNFPEHPNTLTKECHTTTFSSLIAEQAKLIKPINPAPLRHLLGTNHKDAIQNVKALMKMPQPEEFTETCCSTTPQEPGDQTQHRPIQKRVFQEQTALQSSRDVFKCIQKAGIKFSMVSCLFRTKKLI